MNYMGENSLLSWKFFLVIFWEEKENLEVVLPTVVIIRLGAAIGEY